jgi:hypothetical protein
VDGDLLVTTDAESSDGVSGFACRRRSHQNRCSGLGYACPFIESTYCKREFDRSAARAPWRLGSVCHQTRRRRC